MLPEEPSLRYLQRLVPAFTIMGVERSRWRRNISCVIFPVPYCSVAIINSAYAVRSIARSVSGMHAGRRFDVEDCSRSS